MKLGFKTYIHILKRDKLNKINIKYDINPFYDINLFIDKILPLNDYYNKIQLTKNLKYLLLKILNHP